LNEVSDGDFGVTTRRQNACQYAIAGAMLVRAHASVAQADA
jgi:hypothetical protein